MRSKLLWLVIAVVVVGVVGTFAVSGGPWKGSPRKFKAVKVSKGRIETVVNSTGTVKPVKTISVGAFTSGPIKEIYVDFNDQVKEGELLALIDPRLAAATVLRDAAFLDTQKAELQRVEWLLENAVRDEERAKKLKESGRKKVGKDDPEGNTNISDSEMDKYKYARLTAKAQVKLAKASVAQAEATLKNSKENLDYTRITAPEAGKIIERKVDKGQTVASSFQTPELFIIGTEMDKKMHVFASVDEADIGMINSARERGSKVKFTVDAYPGELFEGRIFSVRMSATTIQNVVTYPVVVETLIQPASKKALFPGMTATITFPIEEKDNVLRLPVAALRVQPTLAQVRPEDQSYLDTTPVGGSQRTASAKAERAQNRTHRHVWVQDGNLMRAVPVTLGLIDRQFAEILEGDLAEGQEVITGTELLSAP